MADPIPMTAHYQSSANESKVPMPPNDCISCIRFSPDPGSNSLLVSSWDSTMRIYQVGITTGSGKSHMLYSHAGPVLSCAFVDANRCTSGALDGTVKMFDMYSRHETLLGGHEKAARCVEYADDFNMIYSGSWDTTVKQWDPRVAGAVHTMQQGGQRVYAMATCGMNLVVGTSNRKVLVWDVRQPATPLQNKESSLKYQTRCIRAFPNKLGYVLSSIEGRVAVEYFQESESHKKYAFKCHRAKDDDGTEMIYPVNALAFHPVYNTFATGGSDALVNIWDPVNKKRLVQFHKYNTSVSSLSFSRDGKMLAIACSYQYEDINTPDQIPEDAIYVRRLTDAEMKPKLASNA